MFKKNAISCSVKLRFAAKKRRYSDSSLVRSMAATSSSRSSGLRQRISIRRPLGNNSSAEDANVHSAIHSTGEVIILDRNSYNRAGVEIVMGFVTDAEH